MTSSNCRWATASPMATVKIKATGATRATAITRPVLLRGEGLASPVDCIERPSAVWWPCQDRPMRTRAHPATKWLSGLLVVMALSAAWAEAIGRGDWASVILRTALVALGVAVMRWGGAIAIAGVSLVAMAAGDATSAVLRSLAGLGGGEVLALIVVLLQVQLIYVPLLVLILRLTAQRRVAQWRSELQAVPLAWPLVAGIAGGLVSFAAYWLVAEAETELTGQLFVAIVTAVWIATISQQASDLAQAMPISVGEGGVLNPL